MRAHGTAGLFIIPGGDGLYDPVVLVHGLMRTISGAQGRLPTMEVVTGDGVHEDRNGPVFGGVGHQTMELDAGPYQTPRFSSDRFSLKLSMFFCRLATSLREALRAARAAAAGSRTILASK